MIADVLLISAGVLAVVWVLWVTLELSGVVTSNSHAIGMALDNAKRIRELEIEKEKAAE